MDKREFKFYHADRHSLMSEMSTILPMYNNTSKFGNFYIPRFQSLDPKITMDGPTQRELLLENIRAVQFPQQPSRLSCLFAANTIPDAKAFALSIVPTPSHSIRIFEVFASKFVILDSIWLDYDTADMETRIQYYKQYWWATISQHTPATYERKAPMLEVLLPLPVRMGRIVSIVDS
ncbi:DUF2441 domain-containing protein [Serratia liquefaciens]|uniref:DUF2441 domain-containing protein n=1 Tax=Serratia liquefaciens TaxID=614 RepID=UPI003525F095